MTEHPDALLSAYLDDALGQGEHDRVRAHLDGCARCRSRLAELEATSRLIAAIPPLLPGRSLVPRLDRAPVWLRPVRLLGAMSSGLFAFLFLASAVLNGGASLGGGTTTAERLAEQGKFGAAADALASDAAAKRIEAARSAAAAPAAPAAQGGPAASPPLGPNADQGVSVGAPSPSSGASAFQVGAATPAAATHVVTSGRPLGPPPQAFLGLAVLSAIVAFAAHRRLRRS